MSTLLLRRFLRHPQLVKNAALWIPEKKHYERADNLLPEVHKLMASAHVFVINIGPAAEAVAMKDQGFMPLAPPFPVCWFELLTLSGCIPIFMMRDPSIIGNEITGATKAENAASGPVGMLMHEKSPGLYDVFVMEIYGDLKDEELAAEEFPSACTRAQFPFPQAPFPKTAEMSIRFMGITVFRNLDAYTDYAGGESPPMLEMINRWLQVVNEGVVTHEDTEEVMLIPRADRPHKKTPYVLRRIVRILPKDAKRHSKLEPITMRGVINWSHRWEVRGHWRKVAGLGKDRAGEYVVPHFTWVKEFEKGPLDKQLVVKTRVLTGATK